MFHSADKIGPYTLLRALGHGAFGEVWLAERRSSLLTTQVALKLPLDAVVNLDVIRNEAEVWLKASGHPNIVPVLEAEIFDSQVVIASEYIAGGSLSDWLEQNGGKATSVETAVSMARGILDGLQHLHESGLIHRDLKPDNVLLQKGKPRLTDFGLTRILKPGGHTTNLAGTPGYMAPEAFKGQYSAASDVWAAGILLHEMLTGVLPYPQADFYSLLLAITSDEPVALSDQVPETLRLVLNRALAKPISQRFTSAADMAESLAMSPVSRLVSVSAPRPQQRHNLPVQTTSFIGRHREIAEIKTLLARTRLLTLTGSGGCGKSRLSLRTAAEVMEEYPDGVWLTELAHLADPALVVQAVAQAVGVMEEPGKPLLQTLIQSLKTKNLLLILNNCEHLLAACAQLVDSLLHACPDVRALASSRESLNIAGELTYRVPSLSFPERWQAATARTVGQYESVLLFIERAQFHQPSFTLTDSNAPSVAQLCHRLDGIPLAIELAAARIRSLTVEEVANRLDDRLRLLTGGSRTALPRHQTLRATLDWSYALLSEEEKALLRRLSVFAGGCTLEAAEDVCSDDTQANLA